MQRGIDKNFRHTICLQERVHRATTLRKARQEAFIVVAIDNHWCLGRNPQRHLQNNAHEGCIDITMRL